MIRITPFGAAGEVTGSATLVSTPRAQVVVDLGMFQGDKDDDARNVIPGPIHRGAIDAVLLTHGHLDHCGRLPLFVREGFDGPIYTTAATRDVAEIILMDSANIQESDYRRRQRQAQRKGRKLSRLDAPLYDQDDVEQTIRQMEVVDYNVPVEVAPGITATFHEAGHILGSASISLQVDQKGEHRVVVFSGDLGPRQMPYLKDPEPPTRADIVVLESTYGDRDHRSLDATVEEFTSIIQSAIEQKGKIFIPSFAIGRTQNILYYLAEMIRNGRIPRVPIFLDSPMAIKASQLYAEYTELFDEEGSELVADGQLTSDLRTLRLSSSADQSRSINDYRGPFIVVAGSGMCTAGRIVHHLRNNITNPHAHIVIVGYQARGSLGRALVDGATHVSIMGSWFPVHAQVHTLGGFSAHAGQSQLVDWLRPMTHDRPEVVLLHGEEDPRQQLAERIDQEFNITAQRPQYGESLSFSSQNKQ